MRKIIFAILFLIFAAYGQSKKQVAIINTVDDGNPPIAILELAHLTDKLREIAVGILPENRYSVMTTESIVALFESLEEAAKACNEANCLVEVGRKITADYVAQGRIGRFGNRLTIKVELYNSMSGNLVASVTGNSEDVYGLLSVLDTKAPDMFKNMLEISNNSEITSASVFAEIDSSSVPTVVSESVRDLEKIVDSELENPESEDTFFVSSQRNLNMNVDAGLDDDEEKPKNKNYFWAIASNLVGLGLICAGYIQDKEFAKRYDEYSSLPNESSRDEFGNAWKKVEDAKTIRNGLYITGGLLFSVGVILWF
jgi:TolB-like protein